MLGRAGVSVLLVDPKSEPRPELRCEKASSNQIAILRRMKLADAILAAGTPDTGIWTARFGRLIDRKRSRQLGIPYHALVGAVRGEIPAHVEIAPSKVTAVSTSAEHQQITLASGETISARLVVLASGLNVGLLQSLGIARQVLSACHCITFGFDTAPLARDGFQFPALTYFSERTSDRAAYLSLFPMGEGMRANLFVYRDLDDPWLDEMRADPVATLNALFPNLHRFTGTFKVTSDMQMRPADLYRSAGHIQPGVVLVGDAFATSCPAAGTGSNKVYTDVERLCAVHIPNWLATSGMGADKIAQFYADPIKRACDAWSESTAFHFRSVSVDAGLSWRARRVARFVGRRAQGTLRRWLDSSWKLRPARVG
jgi:2-polyprenyl-6-methoxyphenol hydroxylase-like FAD-dependent oxidoreductase